MDLLIVISGALVVLAFILLVLGLFISDGLGWVYASIGVSIVAGVFLLLGALQRRGELAVGDTGPLEPEPHVTPVYPSRTAERAEATTPIRPAAAAATASGGSVFVVPGRPRYHVAACRFLAGRGDTQSLAVTAARDEGYSACGVCRPDDSAALGTPSDDTLVTAESASELEVAAVGRPASAPVASSRERTAATKGTTRPRNSAVRASKTSGPSKGGTASPRAGAKAGAAGATTGQVIVIPDRDKFHKDSCRFVRGVAGTVKLSKAVARRQGYVACGVCKP